MRDRVDGVTEVVNVDDVVEVGVDAAGHRPSSFDAAGRR